MDRGFSFIGTRGFRLVDYCISTPDILEKVDKFIVASFTTWSDHAPLHLQFHTYNITDISTTDFPNDVHTVPNRTSKWDKDRLDDARSALQSCLDELQRSAAGPETETQETIDSSVGLFTSRLSDVMAPFCELKKRPATGQRKYVYSSRTPIDKPWVTPELKRKYRAYRSDLRLFNNTKTHVAHQKLLESKKSYKVLSTLQTG